MPGSFDDLIPSQQQSGGAFDDLIPQAPAPSYDQQLAAAKKLEADNAQYASKPSDNRIGGPWGSVLDYFDLQKQAQAPEQRSFGAKALTAAGTVAEGLVPHSLEQAGQLAEYPVKMLPSSQVYENAKRVYDYMQGKPALEAATQDIPVAQRVPQYLNAPDSQGRFNAVAGGLADASMFLPILHGEAPVPNVDAAVRESMAQPPPTVSLGPGTTAADVTRAMDRRFTMAPDAPEGAPQMQPAPDMDAILQSLGQKRFNKVTAEGEIPQRPPEEPLPAETARLQPPEAEAANVPPAAPETPPLQPKPAASTIQPTPDELSSSQAQAGQRDTALRAEPEPAAVGGAGAAEGAQGGRGADAVSIKNAYTDAAREKYGLTPAVQEARKSLGQSLVEAQSAESREPGTARRLVDDINSGRVKAIDDKGDGLLTIETIDAQVERSSAEDAVNNARTPDELDIAKARLAAAKDRQQSAYDADKLAGTHTARGLQARQMVAKNDYSITRMEGAARAAQNGRPLDFEQSAYVKDLQKRIETLEKQASQYEAGKSRPRVERMKIKGDAIKARRGGKSLDDFLSEKADAARERIKQMEDVGVDCI